MLKRLEVFFIASIFILVTAIILIIYTMEREQEFRSHSSNIQNSIVNSAAYAINLQLENKRRHINLFLDEYSRLIQHPNRFPEDERTSKSISHRLQQRFTDFFTYTITDVNGNPLLLDIEDLVGEACERDLNNYASLVKREVEDVKNEVFLHPQPLYYHYDIMAKINENGRETRIFFASFYLNEIADTLKAHEVAGQQLLLVRQSAPTLIEVSRQGARDKLDREINLTHDELTLNIISVDIPDTDWRLISLPDDEFEADYISGLWTEVIVILSIISVALFLMISFMFRLSEKNEEAG